MLPICHFSFSKEAVIDKGIDLAIFQSNKLYNKLGGNLPNMQRGQTRYGLVVEAGCKNAYGFTRI